MTLSPFNPDLNALVCRLSTALSEQKRVRAAYVAGTDPIVRADAEYLAAREALDDYLRAQ